MEGSTFHQSGVSVTGGRLLCTPKRQHRLTRTRRSVVCKGTPWRSSMQTSMPSCGWRVSRPRRSRFKKMRSHPALRTGASKRRLSDLLSPPFIRSVLIALCHHSPVLLRRRSGTRCLRIHDSVRHWTCPRGSHVLRGSGSSSQRRANRIAQQQRS